MYDSIGITLTLNKRGKLDVHIVGITSGKVVHTETVDTDRQSSYGIKVAHEALDAMNTRRLRGDFPMNEPVPSKYQVTE